MHSIKITSFFALALSVLVSAQIDPSTVDTNIKEKWCIQQKASCPILCAQEHASDVPASNDCDPEFLTYSCICDNGVTPNATEFSQTIPYFLCTEANTQCANNCGNGNDACVVACRTTRPCGASNPTRQNTSTITSHSATATPSGTASLTGDAADATSTDDFSGFGGDSQSSQPAQSSSAANGNLAAKAFSFRNAESCGLLVVFVGFFAGFSILL